MNTFRMSSSRAKTPALVVGLIALGAVVAACGGGPGGVKDGARDTSADRQYLIGNLAAQREAVNARLVARSFAEYLPNQTFVVGASKAQPEAAGVVRGTVIDAQGVKGYYVPGDGPTADAPGGTETAFDDPQAQWRVIDVTIKVDDGIGIDSADQIHVGITADGPDTKALLNGAKSLGDVVVVLDQQGFFKFDKELYSLDNINSLLGTLAQDGTISFGPLGSESKEFVGSLTTWKKVKSEATRSKRPIETDLVGSRLEQ